MFYGFLSILKWMARLLYVPMKLLPVQRKVVLISRRQHKNSIDFDMVCAHMHDTHPDTAVVVLNHKMTSKIRHILHIVLEMYHLATARAVIVDSYIIPVSILTHRKSLVIVQIWHALGAIKQFGHMSIGKKEGNSRKLAKLMDMHKNYTYVTTGSERSRQTFADAFDQAIATVRPLGMPRVDYLLDTQTTTRNAHTIRASYPDLTDKKVILYAPTFRKNGQVMYQTLIDAFLANAEPDTRLLIKQHPLDKSKPVVHSNRVIFDSAYDVLQLLSVAQYAITDYSAIVFEASLQNIPVFLWTYDAELYDDVRGFALDMKAASGFFASDSVDSVLQAIAQRDPADTAAEQFAEQFVDVRDGSCTKKIVELLPL